jgi:hypothetical protein
VLFIAARQPGSTRTKALQVYSFACKLHSIGALLAMATPNSSSVNLRSQKAFSKAMNVFPAVGLAFEKRCVSVGQTPS